MEIYFSLNLLKRDIMAVELSPCVNSALNKSIIILSYGNITTFQYPTVILLTQLT